MKALCIIWFTLIFALEILSCLVTSIEKLRKYMAYHIIVNMYIIFINKFQLWEYHMYRKACEHQLNFFILNCSCILSSVDRIWLELLFNTLLSRQNGQHFADGILKYFLWQKIVVFWFKFHCNMFPTVQLTVM